MAATRRYHQSGCTGAFSVCTPVRANGAHSGGLILPSFCKRSLSLSIKSVGGTSYAVVIVSARDRKSTRLNSSHLGISYAVFCLKKKTIDRRNARSKTKLPRADMCTSTLLGVQQQPHGASGADSQGALHHGPSRVVDKH